MTHHPSHNPDLPLPLFLADEVRSLDAALIAHGTPGFELMQRAADAAWQALLKRWPRAREVTVLAGGGNNGGDGYLLALLARQAGWEVRVLAAVAPEKLGGDAARAYQAAHEGGVDIFAWSGFMPLQGVVVDALLGTGLSGAVREPFDQLIRQINSSGLPVLAIDIPSGLCADSGRVLGCAVQADLTVTFIALKLGLFAQDGPDRCGELVFAGLQADPRIVATSQPVAQRLDAGSLPSLAPRRRNVHKGQLGHVLVAGGDLGFGGAALLTAEAALRGGAGLVSLATQQPHVLASLSRRPEVMARAVERDEDVLALREQASVLVLGPGLGMGSWGRGLASVLRSSPVPQVWDADALNLLAAGHIQPPLGRWIMTPHPGEAARLLGCGVSEVQASRLASAQALARRWQCVVLLKGAGSLVATPEGDVWLCDRGHPVMAGAGLGDVLAGLLGALLAQGMSCEEAARLGVWLHARAGEWLATQGRGVAASDLIPLIRQLLEEHSPCLK